MFHLRRTQLQWDYGGNHAKWESNSEKERRAALSCLGATLPLPATGHGHQIIVTVPEWVGDWSGKQQRAYKLGWHSHQAEVISQRCASWISSSRWVSAIPAFGCLPCPFSLSWNGDLYDPFPQDALFSTFVFLEPCGCELSAWDRE